VEARRVLHRYALNQYVLTVGKAYQVGPVSLLLLGRSGNVRIACNRVPRIPQLSAAGFHASHVFLEGLPLYVAHLAALYRPPLLPVAVDDTFARDGDILAVRSTDSGETPFRLSFFIDKQPLVGREIENGVFLQVQVDIVFQLDRSAQPYAHRHNEPSTTHLRQPGDGLFEGLRVQGHTVAHATAVVDIHRVCRNLGWCCLCHLYGQVLIILVVAVCCCRGRNREQEHR